MARFCCLPIIFAIALTGCSRSTENAADNATTQPRDVETIEDVDALGNGAPVGDRLPTDDWVGRWTGPEGLFLDIQPSPDGKTGHYVIANQDTLDRKESYSGLADGATIRFVRDGQDLAIRPGTGSETGFKYLTEKKECLIVIPGREGYCR